nr:hypothetical protein [Tanacetum cinerariifolium]
DNDIYSTVDACPNACEMWKAIERFVTLVKQSQKLKTVSYHKLYDILKQHQNEVNEIRAKRITRTANPLALVAQQQPVYHPQNHPTHYTQNFSTRSQQATTRNRGKAIVNSPPPIYDQEPFMVAEDDEMSKDKEIDKLMALISLSFKKIYKPTNNNLQTSSNTSRANQDNSLRINRGTGCESQRIGHVAGDRGTIGTTVVQKSRIQCYNCKEFGHVARECQKLKRVKDAAYHKEKMLLCKQEEARIQLNVEQADWRDDTDDKSEDQELEAHYMYMAQIQEVTPDAADNSGPIFDIEPLQKVSNDDNCNVFAIESKHPEQSKFVHDTYPIERDEHNVIIDSLDKSYDREQLDQDDDDDLAMNKFQAELDRRNDVEYASKVEIDCAKAKGDLISYKMESQKSFNKYTQQINDLNQTIYEMKKEVSAHQETISILSQAKEARIKLYKTREDKELDKVIALENKVKDLKAQLQDKGIAISELKKLIEKLKVKSVDTKFEKSSIIRQPNAFKSQRPSILGKQTIFSNSLERKNFSKSKSVTKNNVSNDFSKPVTAQILPPNKKSILKNTNVLAPGMYKIHTKLTQTRTTQLPHDSRKSNKRVSFSTGVIPTTSVSRPKLKSNPMEDRVMLNNSQGKKQEVEDHRRNVKFSKNKTSVTACNDSLNAKTSNVNFVCATCGKCVLNEKHDMCVLKSRNDVNSRTKMPMVVPINTREPNRISNQSVTKPLRKIVASESINQKPRHTTRKLYENSQELKTVSYHKLYDILKQHQNEVNELRPERIARTTKPLALVAQQQPVYRPQNHPTHYTQNSSTRLQQATTRNREKAIVNSPLPIYDQEPSMVDEDDEMSKDKENDKLMALFSLSRKSTNLPTTTFELHQTPVEQIMIILQGLTKAVEQADWRDGTDDESKDQELEAHYMYMAQIQEVTPDADDDSGPIFDTEPLQKVSNNDNYNVFSIESEHPGQSKYVHDTYPIEQDENNVIIVKS